MTLIMLDKLYNSNRSLILLQRAETVLQMAKDSKEIREYLLEKYKVNY